MPKKPIEDKLLLPGDHFELALSRNTDGSFTFALPDRILKVWANGIDVLRLRYDMPVPPRPPEGYDYETEGLGGT